MKLLDNQVLVRTEIIEAGPFMRGAYDRMIDCDLTDDDRIRPRVLTTQFIDYLNQYFAGWRLLRRVEVTPARYRGGGYYKEVAYVVQLGSDADTETVQSRLRKDGYMMPCLMN